MEDCDNKKETKMDNDGVSQKNLMDFISSLMRTGQEIRTLLAPIEKEDDKMFEILKERNNAIDNLIDVLIDTDVGLKRNQGKGF